MTATFVPLQKNWSPGTHAGLGTDTDIEAWRKAATEVTRQIPVAEIAAVARACSNPEHRRLVVNEQNR